MTPITVQKRNHRGETVWQYSGEVVEQTLSYVCLVATFGRNDVDAGYVTFRRGDRMTEWFYTDRWYNVFRIEDVDDGRLKGWYCNIGRPAEQVDAATIAYDDLALDVFVAPDGAVLVLDEDEFAALVLPDADVVACWAAVEAIRAAAGAGAWPFRA